MNRHPVVQVKNFEATQITLGRADHGLVADSWGSPAVTHSPERTDERRKEAPDALQLEGKAGTLGCECSRDPDKVHAGLRAIEGEA